MERMARYVGRGWPLEQLGEPRIVLSEGRVGALSIHHTRADVERILAIDRRSVWSLEKRAMRSMGRERHRPWVKPGVVLELVFTSDEEGLYSADERRERDEMFGYVIPAEHRIEELRPERDSLVELALDWSTLTPADRIELETGRPSVVFPDGSEISLSILEIDRMRRAIGDPDVAEELDDDLDLCEWAMPGFLVTATVHDRIRVVSLGFSMIGLNETMPNKLRH